jgi:hypothetical protein
MRRTHFITAACLAWIAGDGLAAAESRPGPSERLDSCIRRRFEADLAGVDQRIRESSLDAATRSSLAGKLAGVRTRLAGRFEPGDPRAFRAILPFNEAHADLFRSQAAFWRALGRPALTAWSTCPYDPLDLFAPPPAGSPSPIDVHLMHNEYRSGAFNLANSTDAPLRVTFHLAGLPGGPTPPYISACRVPWTDTVNGQPVAAALQEVPAGEGAWAVDVPPGMVQQVWLTFVGRDLPAGHHEGSLVIRSQGSDPIRIPLNVHMYPLLFPARTTLWLGGWSYTDGGGRYGITPANHRAFVEHLRSRFVNAPWATSDILMKFAFKPGTPPAVELDTARFDDWLTQWPEARAYLVFAAVGDTFGGSRMGTAAFDARVGAWITAWVRHLETKGVDAGQLGLLLVDEPRANEQDDVIIAWAKAIHAAQPRVRVWEDPLYQDPAKGRPAMYELSDILCPNRPMWLSAGPAFERFYLDQQKRGRTLQFYSCSGPVRVLDPYSYYRLQAWHCRQAGATGTFFWAFGDNSGSSSWNEYLANAGPFCPLYLDETTVTAGKHMEAIRESVEDYEYFVMLEALVKRPGSGPEAGRVVAEARSLLERAAGEVLAAPGASALAWHAAKDRTRADQVRVRVLETLASLAALDGTAPATERGEGAAGNLLGWGGWVSSNRKGEEAPASPTVVAPGLGRSKHAALFRMRGYNSPDNTGAEHLFEPTSGEHINLEMTVRPSSRSRCLAVSLRGGDNATCYIRFNGRKAGMCQQYDSVGQYRDIAPYRENEDNLLRVQLNTTTHKLRAWVNGVGGESWDFRAPASMVDRIDLFMTHGNGPEVRTAVDNIQVRDDAGRVVFAEDFENYDPPAGPSRPASAPAARSRD